MERDTERDRDKRIIHHLPLPCCLLTLKNERCLSREHQPKRLIGKNADMQVLRRVNSVENDIRHWHKLSRNRRMPRIKLHTRNSGRERSRTAKQNTRLAVHREREGRELARRDAMLRQTPHPSQITHVRPSLSPCIN